MKPPSYLRRRRRSLAVHWRIAHWIVVTMCALIVTYSSNAWTRAADAAPPSSAAIACAASAVDCVAAPATAASLHLQPLSHSHNSPSSDPSDLWFDLDEEEEDEDGHDDSAPGSGRSLAPAFGVCRPAGAHEGSLTPPGSTSATLFLTESVRRM